MISFSKRWIGKKFMSHLLINLICQGLWVVHFSGLNSLISVFFNTCDISISNLEIRMGIFDWHYVAKCLCHNMTCNNHLMQADLRSPLSNILASPLSPQRRHIPSLDWLATYLGLHNHKYLTHCMFWGNPRYYSDVYKTTKRLQDRIGCILDEKN